MKIKHKLKKSLSVLLTVVLTVSMIYVSKPADDVAAAGENLITNGDFETGALATGYKGASVVTSPVHSGAYAAKVDAGATMQFATDGVNGGQLMDANKQYKMSAYVYVETDSVVQLFMPTWSPGYGNGQDGTDTIKKVNVPANTWTLLEYFVPIKTYQSLSEPRFSNESGGVMYIDNIVLEEWNGEVDFELTSASESYFMYQESSLPSSYYGKFYQFESEFDGQTKTSYIELCSENICYIYSHTFYQGSSMPAVSFCIPKGTVLYESEPVGAKKENGLTLIMEETSYYVKDADGEWVAEDGDNEVELAYQQSDANGNWMLTRSDVPASHQGMWYFFEAIVDNEWQTVYLEFYYEYTYIYKSHIKASKSFRIPKGTVLHGCLEGDASKYNGKRLVLSNEMYVELTGDGWQSTEYEAQISLEFSNATNDSWYFNYDIPADISVGAGNYYQFVAVVDGMEQTIWMEAFESEAIIYAGAFSAFPQTSFYLPRDTVFKEYDAQNGVLVDGGNALTLADSVKVNMTNDIWLAEVTLGVHDVSTKTWYLNCFAVPDDYKQNQTYYQFNAIVDGKAQSCWLEFNNGYGSDIVMWANPSQTATTFRIPAGTMLKQYNPNTGSYIENGKELIVRNTFYIEKADGVWNVTEWTGASTSLSYALYENGQWQLKYSALPADYIGDWTDTRYFQFDAYVDGEETARTGCWCQVVSDTIFIYSGALSGADATTSLYIPQGTILRQSDPSNLISEGLTITVEEDFYVVNRNGAWGEETWTNEPQVFDNTPDADNLPGAEENMVTGGDFTTNPANTFTTIQNATFENGYVKLVKPSDEIRAYIGTPPLNFIAGHTYTVSYYVYVTESNGLILDMQYVSHSSTNGFDKDSAWGTDLVFANYQSGTNVIYKVNDVEMTPSSFTTTTEGWQKVEFTWTAEQNDKADLRLMGYFGSGTFYADDFVVYDRTEKQVKDIVITKAHPSTAGDSWELIVSETTNITSEYYYMFVQVDGVKRKIGVTFDGVKLVIWNDFFGCYDNSGQTYVPKDSFIIPANTILYPVVPWQTTEKDGDRLQVTQQVEVCRTDLGWYFSEKDTSNNPIYFCVDNGMKYLVTSSAGAYEVTKDGVSISSQELTEEGEYLVTRIENAVKVTQKVVLYKTGNANDNDANNNDVVNSQDLVAIKCGALEEHTNTLGEQQAGDINLDGNVDAVDARAMRRALVSDDPVTYLSKVKGNTSLNGKMPIIGFDGPDAKFLNSIGADKIDTIYSYIAELGINTILLNRDEIGESYDYIASHLEAAAQYDGLKLYLNNGYMNDESNDNGIGATTGDSANAKVAQITAKYDIYSSFGGYFIEDEPMYNAPMYDSNGNPAKKDIAQFDVPLTTTKQYTNIHSYMNLAPYIAGAINNQLGGTSSSPMTYANYKKYVDAASAAGAEALSYDLYLRGNGVTSGYWLWETTSYKIHTEDFWTNLDWMRTIAESDTNHNPFYAFVQVGNDFSSENESITDKKNLITVQEMYLEANAALAMGAKGINYYSLVQPEEYVYCSDGKTADYYRSGLINFKGEKNNGGSYGDNYRYYDAAKKINTYVKKVDEVLMNARSTAVVTTNSTVAGYLANEGSSYGSLKSINNTEVMVGCFDYYGQEVFMVVNITPDSGNSGSSQTVTLSFDGEQNYNYTDMNCANSTGTGEELTLTIDAGESVLVVLE